MFCHSRTMQLVALSQLKHEAKRAPRKHHTCCSGFSSCMCGESREGNITAFTGTYSRLLARLPVPQLENSLFLESYPMGCSHEGGSQYHPYGSHKELSASPASATSLQWTFLHGVDTVTCSWCLHQIYWHWCSNIPALWSYAVHYWVPSEDQY